MLNHVRFEVFGHLEGEIALNTQRNICLQFAFPWFVFYSESVAFKVEK